MNNTVITMATILTSNTKTVQDTIDNSKSQYGFGDIFKIFDWSVTEGWKRMNDSLIKMYAAVPYMAVAVCVLIGIILTLILLRIYGLGNGLKYTAINKEIDNFTRLRKRDKAIIRKRKRAEKMISTVERFGLGMGAAHRDYMAYNLKRAGIMASGGQQNMEPTEYNALVKTAQGVCLLAGIFIMLINSILGAGVIVIGCTLMSKVPEYLIRQIVIQKDREIQKGFFRFYGDIHYNIVRSSPTSIKTVVRNYSKMELPPAMEEFVNNVADIFDLYGEYVGSKHVALEYRELPDVGKLMRLIQQYYEGGDVINDMLGFRKTLMLEKQLAMDKQGEKVKAFCEKSLFLVFVILFQVVASTLLNVLPDLMNFGGIF